MELAVEHGDDSGAPLTLPMPLIADKFAQFYWPQTAPYASGLVDITAAVLAQNQGAQAAVINQLLVLRADGASTLSQARRLPGWTQVLGRIAAVVRGMPVRYLQNLGGEAVPFLFDPPSPRAPLVLQPGVAYQLRRFQGFIQQLVRAGWLGHVRGNRRNVAILGQVDDLETFMFGASRQSLLKVGERLRRLDGARCFYCGDGLKGPGQVDHFIAWAQYPRDTSHNFVLAHPGCNRNKRDALAARPHIEHWLARSERCGDDIREALDGLGFAGDWTVSRAIAHWAYSQGVDLGAQAWLQGRTFVPVDAGCAALLA